MDKNDILARLKNGEDITAIAKEAETELNKAIREFEEYEAARKKKEAEEAQKVANTSKDACRAECERILMEARTFVRKYYPEICAKDDTPDPKVLADAVDATLELFEVFKAVSSLGIKVTDILESIAKDNSVFTPKMTIGSNEGSFMDVLNSFLDNN